MGGTRVNLKLFLSTLCVLSISAPVTYGAMAQRPDAMAQPEAQAARAKFISDYNAAKFKDVIADAAVLENLDVLDPQAALVTAQAYYNAGDLAGCAKYIQGNPYLSKDPIVYGEHPVAELLERCQTLYPQP